MTQVRSEIWSMRANLKTLRTRLGDAEDLREGQETLSARIRDIEECITVHHVRENMRRIILLESRVGNSGGVIGDTLRQCQVRLDQCSDSLNDLRERMRTKIGIIICQTKRVMTRHSQRLAVQRQSRIMMLRIVNRSRRRYRHIAQQRRTARAMSGRAPRELTEIEVEQLQSHENSQIPESVEEALQQRLRRLIEAQRKGTEDITQLDSRINQVRHDFRDTMVESALALDSHARSARSWTKARPIEPCGLPCCDEQIGWN